MEAGRDSEEGKSGGKESIGKVWKNTDTRKVVEMG